MPERKTALKSKWNLSKKATVSLYRQDVVKQSLRDLHWRRMSETGPGLISGKEGS